MKHFLWAAVVSLLTGLQADAGPACISGNTLASYIALGPAGCDVGSLQVKDFHFSVGAFGGGAIPLTAAGITVETVFLSDGYGIKFLSSGFRVTGAGFVNYLIAYVWDPTADIRGAADILDPGPVDILTDGCVGFEFVNGTCRGTSFTLHVFQEEDADVEGLAIVRPPNPVPIPHPTPGPVTALALKDSVSFAPTAVLALRNNISLNANGGTAEFHTLENDVVIPEPATLLCLAIGLGILAARYRKRKPRHLGL